MPATNPIPDEMRAFVVKRTTDGVAAEVRTVPTRILGDDAVTVRVEVAGVNYKDGMVTRPGNRVARMDPLIPGVDLAGSVVADASGTFPPGTAVIVQGYNLGIAHHGGFAELARVPPSWVVERPAGMDAQRSMLLGTAGLTAQLSVQRLERMGIAPGGGPVLVTGATGGVGSLSVALLAARGYEVAAVTRSADGFAYLEGLGARHTLTLEDLESRPGRTLGEERWAAAIDCVGGAPLEKVLRTVAYGGAVAVTGLTNANAFATTVYPFIVRNVSLIGVDTVMTPIEDRRAAWAAMSGALEPATIDGLLDRVVGLDGVAAVLAEILEGRIRGRALVEPGRTG